MAMCEKCWSDAFMEARDTGEPQGRPYHRLLEERKDSPCTPKQQAGQWWSEELQRDEREEQPNE
ncbi:hypothetical protein LCGC14_1382480 [marine sediment metagenome]|uniref:Uncharacterized protein n=1 Tax=marine sediment metagenome TaxID=412755 RepID=A0A0F9KN40_9ZZZZ